MTASRAASLFFALLLLLNGCATSPPSAAGKLDVAVPARFTARSGEAEFRQTGWLAAFSDEHLNELVAEAFAHNYDLRAAAARFEAAGANRRIAASSRYPTVQATGGTGVRNTFFDLPDGQTREDRVESYNLGLNLIWEIDLWGRLKNQTQAAIAEFEAEAANYRAAELSLAAATAKAWFDLIESELQLELAEETLRVFSQNLEVVEGSFRRGLPNRALDVRLTRANVEIARGTVEFRRRIRDASARAMEILLGRYPADAIEVVSELPSLSGGVPSGLPSELLQRRPDIIAAERRLAAGLERVKAARKDLLPNVSLTAGAGTSTQDLRDLLDLERLLWNVAGNLSQPVFQAGRLIAGVDLANAAARQALADYSGTVLNGFREVETFLAAEEYLRDEEAALVRAAEESVAAEELAWQQYQRGLVEIITVLESQRRSFNARSSRIGAANARLQNRLNLYLALGGDFSVEAPPALGGVDTQAARALVLQR